MNSALSRATTTTGRRAMRPRRVGILSLSSNANTTARTRTNTSSGLLRFPFPPLLSVSSCNTHTHRGRCFSDAATATATTAVGEKGGASGDSGATADPCSSPKLQGLYDRCVTLPEEEVNILGAMVLQILGRTIFPGEFGTPGGAAIAPDGGAGGGALEEAVEEKTSFDVKLLGFDAKSKIKVIKEVRAIAGLGLKEAKEMVESAPKVIQKDLKQDAAEELKEKLEALGAQIEIV